MTARPSAIHTVVWNQPNSYHSPKAYKKIRSPVRFVRNKNASTRCFKKKPYIFLIKIEPRIRVETEAQVRGKEMDGEVFRQKIIINLLAQIGKSQASITDHT